MTTIFLSNTLSAILDHIEETPQLDLNLLGLLGFKDNLLQRVRQLCNEDQLRFPGEDTCTV